MTHATKQRSAILALAWAIRKECPAMSWGDCQRKAWAAIRLKTSLQQSAVHFTFTKADGTTRQAFGTLCPGLFDYACKGEAKPGGSPAVIRYFDLDANAFRSFRAERLAA